MTNLLHSWIYFDMAEGGGGDGGGDGGDGDGGGGDDSGGGGSDYAGKSTQQSQEQVDGENVVIQDLNLQTTSTRITTSGTPSNLSQQNIFIINPRVGFEIVGKPSVKINSKTPENWVTKEITDSRINPKKSIIFNVTQKSLKTTLSNDNISFSYNTVPILPPRHKMLDGLSIPGLINKKNKVNGNIPATGDYKYITVSGVPGAKFTLTIDNVDDTNVLKEPLDNIEIPENGLYRFLQKFPEISNTSVANEFKINLKVGDSTILNRKLPTTDPMWTINQFADVTVTFTKDTGTGEDVTYSGSDTTITGIAKSKSVSYNTNIHTYAVTAAKAAALVYVKPINNHFSNNNYYFTKKIQENIINSNIIKLADNAVVAKDASNSVVKTMNIEKGMSVKIPGVTKTKIRSIDATLAYPETDKITLDHVNDLFVGMSIFGNNATIISIDNETDITLSRKIDITNGTAIIFEHLENEFLIEEVDLNTQYITINGNITLNKYNKITIIADKTKINNNITVSGSGSASATFTNNLQIREFSEKNVIYTQSLDDTFTLTPNVYNQNYSTYKDTAININVLSKDWDDNVSTKTPSIVGNPRHGVISGSFGSGDGIVTYTPVGAYTGKDSFTFKVNDTITDSNVATVYITIK